MAERNRSKSEVNFVHKQTLNPASFTFVIHVSI